MTPDETLAPLLDAVLAIAEDVDLDGVLDRVVHAARDLVGARYAALGVLAPSRTSMARFLHVGVDAETAARIGPLPTGRGVLGEIIHHPTPLLLDDLGSHPSSCGFPPHHPPMTTFLGVPVVVGEAVFGNLYLTDKAGGFTAADQRLVIGLAAVAGAAIRNARDVEALEHLAVRVDRERIARDLHDTVIQRLFGAGLQLDGLSRRLADEGDAATVETVIAELDAAIGDLRATIAAMQDPGPRPLTARLHAVVAALWPVTDGLADLQVEGDPDTVPSGLGDDLVAVLREGITNARRHAAATRITPLLRVGRDRVEVVVRDDGAGIDDRDARRPGSGLGLGNLRARAEQHRGGCELEPVDGGGAQLRWWAPLTTL